MAKQSTESNVQFTDEELMALRDIVIDWINEGIVIPPYDDATTSVIAKVGARRSRVVTEGVARGRTVAAEREEQAEPVVIRPTANLG